MLQRMMIRVPAPQVQAAPALTTRGNDGVVELETRYISPSPDTQANALVLFLPFWGGSATTFESVMSRVALRDPEAALLSVSYAGTGSTPVPVDDRAEAHSIVPRAEQVVSLLRTAEVKALCQNSKAEPVRLVICAHSMSAKIAYVVSNTLAEDVGFDVSGLVLLAPAPIGPLVLPETIREQQLHAYDSLESARWTVEHVLTQKDLDTGLRDGLARDCTGMSSGAKNGWLMHGMEYDCVGYLRKIKQRWPELKIHVLVGECDRVETVERVKNETIVPLQKEEFVVEDVVVGGSGHLLPVEAVDEVAEAVVSVSGRFLLA